MAEVVTLEARLDPLLITVLLPERSAGGHASARILPQAGGVYEVNVGHSDHTARCRIFDTGTVPEFQTP